MYLSAEEKQIGKENFYAAIGSPFVRRRRKDKDLSSREFLQQVLREGGTPAAVRAAYFGYDKTLKEPVRVGVIGTGDQGCRLIGAMNPEFLEVKAVADIRPSSLARAALAGLKASKAWEPKQYGAYKELLDHAKADGIEAIVIALPSHLHAEVAKAAIEAGLHVFLETPLALTVADAKDLVRILAEKGKDPAKPCLAVGYQRRYSLLYDNAVLLSKSGLLGSRIHYLRAQWHCADDWKPKALAADKTVDAKQHGYQSLDELLGWRLWTRTSGGLMVDVGSHLIDAAAMFLDAMPNKDKEKGTYPLSVAGSAAQLIFHPDSDVDDHVYGVFEVPVKGYLPKGPKNPEKAGKKIGLQFNLMQGSDFDSSGETVLGTEGTLVIEAEQTPLLYRVAATTAKLQVVEKTNKEGKTSRSIEVRESGDAQSTLVGQAVVAAAADPAGYAAELEHWACCIRNPAPENRPRCDAKTALANLVMAVAATRATKAAGRIDFNNDWFDPDSDETPDGSKPKVKAAEKPAKA